MIAIDGPFEGKLYRDVPDETQTLIDHYRTFEEFYKVTYKRTDDGWKHVKTEPMFSELLGTELNGN